MRRSPFAAYLLAVLAITICLIVVFRNMGGSDIPPLASSLSSPEAPPPNRVDRPVMPSLPTDVETWQSMIDEADDLESLMASAMKIGDPEMRRLVAASIIDRWIVADPAGFIGYLNALEVDGNSDWLATVVLALQDSLTRLSPESAGSDEVLVVVQRLISYLASTDPATGLEWAKRFLLDDTLDSALVSIARGMSRTDVDAGLRIADSIPSTLRRSQAFAAVGTVWAAKDPAAALGWAVSLKNHSERALSINSVLLVTARLDLPAAARSLSDQAHLINEQYLQERAAQMAAAGVTEADLANDPDTYREMLESGAVSPPSSPDVELMAVAGKLIGSKLAEGDAPAAIAWAESLSGDYLKLTSLAGAIDGWAATDPGGALDFVVGNYPTNIDLHNSVYRSWAATEPLSAALAAREIANPDHRASALENVMKEWALRGNPDEAASFVAGLQPSGSTDAAAFTLANAISYHQPEQAWRIAQGIGNESVQYRALKSAFSVMVTQDAQVAGRMLAAAPNLPSRTTELLSGLLGAVDGD